MKSLLETLTHWLAANAPQLIPQLRPAATELDVQAIEKATALFLPESFKTFLYWHNGELGENGLALLGDGHQLLSCESIIQQYRWGQETSKQFADPQFDTPVFWKDRVSSGVIAVKGPVKPLMNHPHWLPFTCMNGDVFRFLDFDPAPGGHRGQVIEVDPENCAYQVLASDFESFLKNYVEALKANHYHVDETGYIETQEQDPMDWGIPEWL